MIAHCTINAQITQYLEFLGGFHAAGKHFHTATVGNIHRWVALYGTNVLWTLLQSCLTMIDGIRTAGPALGHMKAPDHHPNLSKSIDMSRISAHHGHIVSLTLVIL